MYSQIMSGLPGGLDGSPVTGAEEEGVGLVDTDADARMEAAGERDVLSRDRRQTGTGAVCPQPSLSTVVAQNVAITNQTDWHAFPDPQNGVIWLSWARDSQEEMLVTITRPQGGDNRRAIWLSRDKGANFDPVQLVGNFPQSINITKCQFGNLNSQGKYNAYCTYTQNAGVFGAVDLRFVGMLFSFDSGVTWQVKNTVLPSNAAVPIDVIEIHPVFPGVLIAMRTIDARRNLYRPYYGVVTIEPQMTLVPLTPSTNGVQQLASWAGWATGGTNANNTIFIMAEESPSISPYNGLSLRKATIVPGTTPRVTVPMNPINGLSDIADFTQINSFFCVEYNLPHGGTRGGFNDTALMLSSDGVTFTPASLPVGPTELAEEFEVVDASAGQITLAAQHTTARMQGEVQVQVTIGSNVMALNASRALFSDAIPETPPSNNQPAFIFDPTNPYGCNSSWHIDALVARTQQQNFYLVVRRGNYPNGSICYFAAKLENALNAGAAGLIVVNNRPSSGRPNLYMVAPEGYDTSQFGSVPCLIVSQTEGEGLIGNLTQSQSSSGTVAYGTVFESNQRAAKLWQYTQLYISDGTTSFSRSLRNVLYVVNRNVEYVGFYAVGSMGVDPAFTATRGSGTFLANQGSGGTLVSTNKGATWQRCMHADGSGAVVVVLDALSAQHGWSTPKSVVTAPGLVVANAQDGMSHRNLYPTAHISRDGGVTWTDANPQTDYGDDDTVRTSGAAPYLFDILDHGSVVVLMETTSQTSAVYYSLDEGDSWSQFAFYNATTLLGRWWGASNRAFDCYPIYNATRPQSRGAGFVLFCRGMPWASGSAGQNFTVDTPIPGGTGFSGSADGVTQSAYITSVTAGIASDFPLNSSVTFDPATARMIITAPSGNTTMLSRPGGGQVSDPHYVNSHHIRFLASITNSRASSTQIFGYWLQSTPVGRSIIGMRFDFSGLLTRNCSASDYEAWNVGGPNGGCYLGFQATLSRRQQCQVCRQVSTVAEISTERAWQNWEPCPCRSYDYACVYGYRRVLNVQGLSTATPTETCTIDSTVGVAASSVWYRKIPGDVCRGTITHGRVDPDPNSNPSNGGGGGGSGGSANMAALVAVFVLVVLIVAGGGVVAYRKGWIGGGLAGPRYVEIRADDTLASANDVTGANDDDDDDDDDGDDDLIDATLA